MLTFAEIFALIKRMEIRSGLYLKLIKMYSNESLKVGGFRVCLGLFGVWYPSLVMTTLKAFLVLMVDQQIFHPMNSQMLIRKNA